MSYLAPDPDAFTTLPPRPRLPAWWHYVAGAAWLKQALSEAEERKARAASNG